VETEKLGFNDFTTIEIDCEAWFVTTEVCKILGKKNKISCFYFR